MTDSIYAFLLTLGAGLFTMIGGSVVYIPWLANLTDKRFLAVSLGFATGVMVYISFTELFSESVKSFIENGNPHKRALLYTSSSFFSGIALVKLIDVVVDSIEDYNERNTNIDPEQALTRQESFEKRKLSHTGIMTALAVMIHNFPEGMATYMSGTLNIKLGATLAIAVAIHNIPEGVCVAMPIYYSTGNRHKAFIISVVSGLAEPVGALLCWAIIYKFMSSTVYATIFGMVSGIMSYISLSEMYPLALQYMTEGNLVNYSLISGFLVMAISLCLFD